MQFYLIKKHEKKAAIGLSDWICWLRKPTREELAGEKKKPNKIDHFKVVQHLNNHVIISRGDW